jgi:Fic family protein
MHIKTCHPQLLPIKHLEWKDLVSLIGDAREAIARLDEKLLHEKNSKDILEPLYWQESISSIRSQNIRTIFQDVIWVRFSEISPEKSAALLQRIVAAKEALDIAIRWGQKKKIGQQFFCHIHRAVKKNSTYTKDIGRIRDRQNWIGPEGCKIEEAYFYPPLALRLKPLLHNLETYLAKQDLDPLVQIAIAFAQFLIIHPFMDGNGRVARIFIPVCASRKKILTQPALFMSEYFEEHREDYFQKLFMISEKNAWEDWIAFFLTGVVSQAKKTYDRLDRLTILWDEIVRISDEEIAALIFHQPLLSNSGAGMFKKLIKQKFLIAQGEEYLLFEPLIRAMRNC